MPQKSLPKTRTWGSRFDPLPSSPPISPQLPEAVVANKPLFANVTEESSDISFKRRDDKMPHDASIFVGSLPSNVDQQELAHLLSDHLFEHAEVKNIKVVRDTKGGVCAFVQCEDASSAARLIQNLHSSEPRPFLGRILRYEPARAFRTLLISYRTPMQFTPFGIPGPENVATSVNNEGQFHELELPFAMRLWKPWKAKFTSILYNAEARNAESQALPVSQGQSVLNSNNGATLYLDPLIYDAETVRKLASHFGTLEHFGPSLPVNASDEMDSADSGDSWKSYPAPHNAPRTSDMDAGCWEVKWDHRDDCVSALMTLRRVPHLTVTWAHQPMSSRIDNHSPVVSFQSQRLNQSKSSSFHFQEREDVHPPGEGAPSPLGESLQPSTSLPAQISELLSPTLIPSASDGWSREHVKDGSRALNHQLGQSPHFSDIVDGKGGTLFGMDRLEWTETDFPPLGDFKGGERRAETGVWADKRMTKVDNEHIRSPASSTTALITPRVATTPLANSPLANSNAISNKTATYKGEQELDIPPTPELGMSPITPKTPGSIFPDTPTGYVGNFQTTASQEVEGKNNYYGDLIGVEKDLDPTTIFVGGLEMFGPAAWNEEKVHSFFAKFGMVENVKLVRPLNGRSAFAFVKFNDTDAPAHAVHETHNSMHDGRQMRVQLRDCNPPNRGAWRYGRGRGRYPHYAVQRQYSEPVNELNQKNYVCGLAKTVPHDQVHEFEVTEQQDKNIGHVSIYATTVTEFPTLNSKERPISRSQFSDCFDQTFEKTADERHSARSHGRTTEPTAANHKSSPEPSAGGTSQNGGYREWYEEPASSNLTPPSSSFGSSASATAPTVPPPFIPYPMPNLGFYPPQGWMPPVPQHFPYPMPYIASYPRFNIAPSQPHSLPSPAGSDAGGPTGAPNAWGHIGGMYTPYPPVSGYPAKAMNIDPSQTQQSNGQPPLVPSGFIHGEQGTLIAVYHPEALDHYMSTGRPGAPTLQQPQAQNGSTWPQHPQPPPFNFQPPVPPGFSSQAFQGNQNHPQPGINMSWIPGAPPLGLPHTAPIPFMPNQHAAQTAFHGGHLDVGASNTPPPRRNHRREQNTSTYNGNRNNHTRSVPNRYPRGGGGNLNQLARQPQNTHPHFVPFTGDWGQWGASR